MSENLPGGFRLIEIIKKDEYSSVVKAEFVASGETVLLKTFSSSGDARQIDRFRREAALLQQLDHPGIVKIISSGMFEKGDYIALEYIQGTSLGKLMDAGLFSNEDKMRITSDLLDGLTYIHSRGIVHRDLKPDNILITPNLQIKIVDFGLSFSGSEGRVTRKNEILGTPAYMPPECLRGEEHTFAGDAFSLGLIIYELYTGRNPLKGESLSDTLNRIANYSLVDLDLESQPLPEKIKLMLTRLLSEDPASRIFSLSESEADGQISRQQAVSVAPIATNGIAPRGWLRNGIASLLFAALLTVAAVFLFGDSSNSEGSFNDPGTSPVSSPGTQEEPSIEKAKPGKDDLSIDPAVEPEVKTTGDDLAATATPQGDNPGFLDVKCYPWGELYIDGKYYDTTPLKGSIKIKPGTYTLKVVNPAFDPVVRRVTISPEMTTSEVISFAQGNGYVTVNVFPWAEVFINERSYGVTPLTAPISLPSGTYTITLRNSSFGTFSEPVTVKPGVTTSYSHKFDQAVNGSN